MKTAVRITILSIVTILIYIVAIAAQQKESNKVYTPTEVQSLRLQVKLKDAQMAQQALQIAQQNAQKALIEYQAEAEKVKNDNGWPKDVRFDPNNMTFSEPPKEEKK